MSTPLPAAQPTNPPPRRGWKILKSLLALFVVASATIALLMTIQPDIFHVERTAAVDASPHVVHAIINDLHQWDRWSPYDKLDPNMKKSHSGPETGTGSIYSWEGNDQVGAGKLTIVDSRPDEAVMMKLEFTRPFECSSDVKFTVIPTDKGSSVSWSMDGKNTFFCRFFSLFMNMDRMIGNDFEVGLANLNKIANETPAKAAFENTAPPESAAQAKPE